MIATGFLSPLLKAFFPAFETPESPGWLVWHSLIFHGAGLLLIAIMVDRRGLGWNGAFGVGALGIRRCAGLGILYYVMTLPVVWLSSSVFHVVLWSLGIEPTLQTTALSLTDEHGIVLRIYLLTLAVFVAPLVEELMFRGMLLPVLVRRFGLARGVILVAIIFGLIHAHLASMPALMLLSVALSLAYIYTRSIIVPIVMHMAFNGVSVGMLLVLRYL